MTLVLQAIQNNNLEFDSSFILKDWTIIKGDPLFLNSDGYYVPTFGGTFNVQFTLNYQIIGDFTTIVIPDIFIAVRGFASFNRYGDKPFPSKSGFFNIKSFPETSGSVTTNYNVDVFRTQEIGVGVLTPITIFPNKLRVTSSEIIIKRLQ